MRTFIKLRWQCKDKISTLHEPRQPQRKRQQLCEGLKYSNTETDDIMISAFITVKLWSSPLSPTWRHTSGEAVRAPLSTLETRLRPVVKITPPAVLPPSREPSAYCIGSWVSSRAGLEDLMNRSLRTLPRFKHRFIQRVTGHHAE
jgi:hypothetical protein